MTALQSNTLKPDTLKPQKIYLKDYKRPNFMIDHVDLIIQVFDDKTLVISTLTLSRQDVGDLVLFGRGLDLLALQINGQNLTCSDYVVDDEQLLIKNTAQFGDKFTLSSQVKIHPENNTSLEGLYGAGEGDEMMFVTQCEPEGFRKITYFLDRPDVLATYHTRLEADKKFPTLLANGNLVEQGELADNRHYAVWEDPTKKPSYLFACVVADLAVLTDHYTTIEGREVLLQVYAKPQNINQCHVAMQALKDAMHWDEAEYGRAYDLDRYMIVAVSQFNMGAMENKGLNIFNTSCVLSSPDTTTDRRNFTVKAVIAHEYFHNWTGNRITCRDWFQLCLKEGFTVFRDQSFSATLHSPAVQRIDDVAVLKAHQFPEDLGPLAHPPRPDHFVEINNFYTATVYEKGAEIVRMIANTLGKEKFRQGTDEYFRRYDGQAVTVEDLLSALSVSGVDVMPFLDWYTQPATPVLSGRFSQNGQMLDITLAQTIRKVADYPPPKNLPIPVKMAIFNRSTGELVLEDLLLLNTAKQTFSFDKIDFDPVISLLRDFSAPVDLHFEQSDADLAFLMQYETNGFNRWQAAQTLVNRVLTGIGDSEVYFDALQKCLAKLTNDTNNIDTNNIDTNNIDLGQNDLMLASRLLDIPTERELASVINHAYDPSAVKQRRDKLIQTLAVILTDFWQQAYQNLPITEYQDTAYAMGKRAWRNIVLDMALHAGLKEAQQWAVDQYHHANCMSERLGGLVAALNHDLPKKDALLADFYQRFGKDKLAMDLWFSVQANSDKTSVAQIFALLEHTDFDINTPNRVRAVIGGLLAQPTKLWQAQSLEWFMGLIVILDKRNPLLASRLLQGLSNYHTLIEPLKSEAKQILTKYQNDVQSKNVIETLQNMLNEN
ncbi:aminopeptidase N [Moraxella macacae 0408225]|uniref:Aminopeptidase N n=1 Tax=Moraxella macacae 0408225 TaxID=1230338 RepID=L2F7V3_9GAMM|nr:aminopeptidase N [Moraxella macacae]ELA08543.1 aminopeptidase N [Moraxella macacae 0408225]